MEVETRSGNRPWLFRFDKFLDIMNPDYTPEDARDHRWRVYAWGAILIGGVWVAQTVSFWANM